jgi:PTH1 family peptidyl-tRNA hydrolase
MFVDYMLQKISPSSELSFEKKYDAETAELSHHDEKWIFLKPQTFMNLSGQSVQKVAAFYKITPDNIFVAHDDLDIPIGKFKLNIATGPKLHNGLSSIEERFDTKDFWRIRIGVENRPTDDYRLHGDTYVLQIFNPNEQAMLPDVFQTIFQRLQQQKIL